MTHAVRISSLGGPEVLEIVEVPDPLAPNDGVVIEVRAAGVNPIDWKIREGRTTSGALAEPIGLGSDVSGVIVSVGSGAGEYAVGLRKPGGRTGRDAHPQAAVAEF